MSGSRTLIDNGRVKTVLSKEIQNTGYMSVGEMYQLISRYPHYTLIIDLSKKDLWNELIGKLQLCLRIRTV